MSFKTGDLVVINHFRKDVVGVVYQAVGSGWSGGTRSTDLVYIYLTTGEATTRHGWECVLFRDAKNINNHNNFHVPLHYAT